MENIDVENLSAIQWEKWFWKTVNEKCSRCENNCKQSSKVTLICKKFSEGN